MTKEEIEKLKEDNIRLKSLFQFLLQSIEKDIKKINSTIKLAKGTFKDMDK